MPELASDPNLGCTGKEGGINRHRGHRIGVFIFRRSECFVYRQGWGSPTNPELFNEWGGRGYDDSVPG